MRIIDQAIRSVSLCLLGEYVIWCTVKDHIQERPPGIFSNEFCLLAVEDIIPIGKHNINVLKEKSIRDEFPLSRDESIVCEFLHLAGEEHRGNCDLTMTGGVIDCVMSGTPVFVLIFVFHHFEDSFKDLCRELEAIPSIAETRKDGQKEQFFDQLAAHGGKYAERRIVFRFSTLFSLMDCCLRLTRVDSKCRTNSEYFDSEWTSGKILTNG